MGIREKMMNRIYEEEYDAPEDEEEVERNVNVTEKPRVPLYKMSDIIKHPDAMLPGTGLKANVIQEDQDPERQNTLQQKIREELKDMRRNPTPPGIFVAHINGRPIDLHMLEEYILAVSPTENKIVTRYHNARMVSKMKGYLKGENKK